jgi:hypothetical protein
MGVAYRASRSATIRDAVTPSAGEYRSWKLSAPSTESSADKDTGIERFCRTA